MLNPMIVERISEREVSVSRTFGAPARAVFEAWTTPALFMQWWAPKSMGVPLLSCDMDVRAGGTYRLTFGQDAASAFAFFGRYLDVIPGSLIMWTNDEGADGAITTVTLEEKGDQTLLVFRELYPTKAALDDACAGMQDGMGEQFDQLDALLRSAGVATL